MKKDKLYIIIFFVSLLNITKIYSANISNSKDNNVIVPDKNFNWEQDLRKYAGKTFYIQYPFELFKRDNTYKQIYLPDNCTLIFVGKGQFKATDINQKNLSGRYDFGRFNKIPGASDPIIFGKNIQIDNKTKNQIFEGVCLDMGLVNEEVFLEWFFNPRTISAKKLYSKQDFDYLCYNSDNLSTLSRAIKGKTIKSLNGKLQLSCGVSIANNNSFNGINFTSCTPYISEKNEKIFTETTISCFSIGDISNCSFYNVKLDIFPYLFYNADYLVKGQNKFSIKNNKFLGSEKGAACGIYLRMDREYLKDVVLQEKIYQNLCGTEITGNEFYNGGGGDFRYGQDYQGITYAGAGGDAISIATYAIEYNISNNKVYGNFRNAINFNGGGRNNLVQNNFIDGKIYKLSGNPRYKFDNEDPELWRKKDSEMIGGIRYQFEMAPKYKFSGFENNTIRKNTIQNITDEAICFESYDNGLLVDKIKFTQKNNANKYYFQFRNTIGINDFSPSVNPKTGYVNYKQFTDNYDFSDCSLYVLSGKHIGKSAQINTEKKKIYVQEKWFSELTNDDLICVAIFAKNNIINDNTITNCGRAAISLYGCSSENEIRNNQISNITQDGISIKTFMIDNGKRISLSCQNKIINNVLENIGEKSIEPLVTNPKEIFKHNNSKIEYVGRSNKKNKNPVLRNLFENSGSEGEAASIFVGTYLPFNYKFLGDKYEYENNKYLLVRPMGDVISDNVVNGKIFTVNTNGTTITGNKASQIATFNTKEALVYNNIGEILNEKFYEFKPLVIKKENKGYIIKKGENLSTKNDYYEIK